MPATIYTDGTQKIETAPHSRNHSSATAQSAMNVHAITGKYPETCGKSFMMQRSMLSLSVK